MAAKQMVAEIHAEVADHNALQTSNGGTPIMSVIQMAIAKIEGENGPAIAEALKGLYDLYERDQDRRAKTSFNRAFAEFQADCPQIFKDSTAKIATKSGASFSYKYAELDQIDDAIKPLMKRLRLSKYWTTDQQGGNIRVTCVLCHEDGYSIQSTFECPTDSKADMSGAQRNGAAVTYAKRQSLVAVLGLTTTETDTDAQRHVGREEKKITPDQADNIQSLIDETQTDRAKFLGYFQVSDVSEITAAQFDKAIGLLEKKRGAK